MAFCGEGGAKLVLAPVLLGSDMGEAAGFWDKATTAFPGLHPACGFTKKAFSFIWDCDELALFSLEGVHV